MNKNKFFLFGMGLCLCYVLIQCEEPPAGVFDQQAESSVEQQPDILQKPVEVSVATPSVDDTQSDEEDDEERPEPEVTIGDACIYPGTYQCRCGDAHMGCKSKKGCLKYCRFED